jgi:hypothetical protein
MQLCKYFFLELANNQVERMGLEVNYHKICYFAVRYITLATLNATTKRLRVVIIIFVFRPVMITTPTT